MPLLQRISPKTLAQSLGAKLFRIFVGLGDRASSEQGKTLGLLRMLADRGRRLEPGESYGRDKDMHLTNSTRL